MTQKTFQSHVPRHPEIPRYLLEAQATISDPDIVMEADNGAVYLYRFGIANEVPYKALYLMVVVYYGTEGEREGGTVATYHFTDELSKSAQLVEQRAQTIAGTRFKLTEGQA